MSDQSQERTPDGGEESTAAQVGEPVRDSDAVERRAREEERPDLDERERQIPTQVKRMGPPLEEPEACAEDGVSDSRIHHSSMSRLRATGGDVLIGETSSLSRSRAGWRSPTRTPWVPAFRCPARRWRGFRSCP
jgi:hypothetical protein